MPTLQETKCDKVQFHSSFCSQVAKSTCIHMQVSRNWLVGDKSNLQHWIFILWIPQGLLWAQEVPVTGPPLVPTSSAGGFYHPQTLFQKKATPRRSSLGDCHLTLMKVGNVMFSLVIPANICDMIVCISECVIVLIHRRYPGLLPSFWICDCGLAPQDAQQGMCPTKG